MGKAERFAIFAEGGRHRHRERPMIIALKLYGRFARNFRSIWSLPVSLNRRPQRMF
jgi:hypothetical protein